MAKKWTWGVEMPPLGDPEACNALLASSSPPDALPDRPLGATAEALKGVNMEYRKAEKQ